MDDDLAAVPTERIAACLDEASRAFETYLHRLPEAGAADARGYLASRGFGSAACKRWGIGYAPGHGRLTAYLTERGFTPEELVAADLSVRRRDGCLTDRFFDRVTFPIHDEDGRTIAFSARATGAVTPRMGGKYVNSRETALFSKRNVLYGLDKASDEIAATGEAILCEGYTDVIAMHEAGFRNAVATMGTALTASHVKSLESLAPNRVICMFDGDEAGQRAAERALELTRDVRADIACVTLPGGRDPMEFLSDLGPDEMRECLLSSVPLHEFVLDRRLSQFDLSVPGQVVQASREAEGVVADLVGSWRGGPMVRRMSEALRCERQTVLERLGQDAGKDDATDSSETRLLHDLAILRPLTQEQAERVSSLPWSTQVRRELAARIAAAGDGPLDRDDLVVMTRGAADPTRPTPASADEAIDRAELAMLQAAIRRQARALPECRDADGLAAAEGRLDKMRTRLEAMLGGHERAER